MKCFPVTALAYSLHVVVTLFAATNNTPTSSSTPTINNNNNTPPPKAGSPSSGGGSNNLTELKPVQPTMSQSYTPLPSFSGQFSSKHALYLVFSVCRFFFVFLFFPSPSLVIFLTFIWRSSTFVRIWFLFFCFPYDLLFTFSLMTPQSLKWWNSF